MPEGSDLDYVLQQQLLTHSELLTLLREVFIPVGFTKFRLTGGEPLLRPGVVELVGAIASLPETRDLSMTTNGFLLAGMAEISIMLVCAGLILVWIRWNRRLLIG